jgi:subtilase family serine protease
LSDISCPRAIQVKEKPLRQHFISPLVIGVLAGLLTSSHSAAQATDRISAQIDSSKSVTLQGNVLPKARIRHDLGPVAKGHQLPYMTMWFKHSAHQMAEVRKLLAEQQDRSSSNYHRWITLGTYADRFGLTANDMKQITDWLKAEGFKIVLVARGRDFVAFSGTAAQVERTFKVQIHHYEVDGERRFANVDEPSIPAALQDIVGGIHGLDNIPLRPTNSPTNTAIEPVRSHYTYPGGPNIITPDDIQTIYDLTTLHLQGYSGSGQTIVVVGQSDIDVNDIQLFRSIFQLPAINLTIAPPVPSDPGYTTSETEADLDLEWVGAVARDANIVYLASSTSATDAAISAIDQNLGTVINISFGTCEASTPASYMSHFEAEVQKANLAGTTVLASSGDTGAAGCESKGSLVASTPMGVQFPASVPEVTAVGGTEFILNDSGYWGGNGLLWNSAISYIPEVAWNDPGLPTGLASGGGGASSCATQDASSNCTGGFAKPTWQVGMGVPNDGVRDVPDVAFDASPNHDGYWICAPTQAWPCANGFPPPPGNNFVVEGGTSVATPIFAGMVAMLSQYAVQSGFQSSPGMGNINPDLYLYAQNYPAAFHDVTSGSNVVPCVINSTTCPTGAYGYNAGPGYDQATGLGSIDAGVFFTNWSQALPPPNFSVTPSTTNLTISYGSSGQVTFSIADENGYAQAVAFTCSISGLPSATTCTFNPASVPAGSSPSTVMSIQAPAQSRSAISRTSRFQYAMLVTGLGIIGLVFRLKRPSVGRLTFCLGIILLTACLSFVGCGGSSSQPYQPPPPPVSGTVTVTATGGGSSPIVQTAQIAVTFQ